MLSPRFDNDRLVTQYFQYRYLGTLVFDCEGSILGEREVIVEMPTNSIHSTKGTSMKKTVLVAALAAVLVFAFAASAFASTFSNYIAFSSAGANAGSLATPHKDYRLTTEKCAVCHAVHKANTAGQILLDTTVTDACNYCHIRTASSYTQVYNSDPTWRGSSTKNHTNSCSGCHAVHGANTIDTPFASVNSAILRETPSGNAVQAGTGWDFATAANTDEAISLFCTGCHPYFVGNYEDTHAGSFGSGSYKGHIMTDDFAAYGSAFDTVGDIAVAYASSAYCQSCHDDGDGSLTNNFPHYTTGVRFMLAATDAADTAVPAVSATQDGACLKCHDNGAGSGVSTTF